MQKVSEDAGITAFIDKRGRSWNMASYTDMLCRTSSMQIFHQAKTNEYLAHGEDLVIVSSHSPTCDKCAPWNGKVLSLTGETPGYPTMEEAKAAGLFHPNCRHTYNLYIADDDYTGNDQQPKVGNGTNPEFASRGENTADEGIARERRGNEIDLKAVFKDVGDERMRAGLIRAFDKAPDGIKRKLERFIPFAEYYETAGRSFQSGDKVYINIEKALATAKMNYPNNRWDGDRLGHTLRHETGHYLDHRLGLKENRYTWSCSGEMDDAIMVDRKAFTGGGKAKGPLREAMAKAIGPGSDYYNHPAVSDIFCSMSKGWIRGFWGHAIGYYRGAGARVNAEVFAQLTSIYANNEQDAVEFLKKWFPNTVKVYEEKIKGEVGK